jgi:hypothetical protein
VTDRLEQVIDLERQLHRLDVRRDRDRLEQLLTPDFTEIGVSGRIYDRLAIMVELQHDLDDIDIQARDFSARRVADDVILVHYETDGPSGPAHRTSLWVRYFDSWRIAFHQGTRA